MDAASGRLLERLGLLDHAQNIAFLHDEQILAIDAHLGARPFAEQDAVAGLDVERRDGAVFGAGARADGDDFALLRLFLCGVGDDDAARGLLLGFDAADDHTVVQGTEMHALSVVRTFGADRGVD